MSTNRPNALVAIAVAVVSACAGSAPEPQRAQGSNLSRGDKCLMDASEPRSPNPDAPTKIGARHILVRHTELKDPRGAARTRKEACLRALAALEVLSQGQSDWEAAVAEYSDAKSDDLGRVAQDDLSPTFANAAFSLDVDQLSYVVESDRGFHVILRTE